MLESSPSVVAHDVMIFRAIPFFVVASLLLRTSLSFAFGHAKPDEFLFLAADQSSLPFEERIDFLLKECDRLSQRLGPLSSLEVQDVGQIIGSGQMKTLYIDKYSRESEVISISILKRWERFRLEALLLEVFQEHRLRELAQVDENPTRIIEPRGLLCQRLPGEHDSIRVAIKYRRYSKDLFEKVANASLERFSSHFSFHAEEFLEKLTSQLCHGIQFFHQHDIAHRDIKPENLFLDEFNNITIADLGVVLDRSRPWITPALVGTEGYTPFHRLVNTWSKGSTPEEIQSNYQEAQKMDYFGFAVVVYFVMNADLPNWDYGPDVMSEEERMRSILKTAAKITSPPLKQKVIRILQAALSLDLPHQKSEFKAACDAFPLFR